MKKVLATVLASGLLLVPIATARSVEALDTAEGCEAVNPAQSTCTYKTAEALDTFGGAAGEGDWIVTVVVGKGKKKQISTYTSPSDGSPTGEQFMIPAGATVTAKALSAGSGVVVGGE